MKSTKTAAEPETTALIRTPGPNDMIPVPREQLLAIQNDIIGKLPCGEVFNASLWIQVAIRNFDEAGQTKAEDYVDDHMRNRVTEDGLTTDIAENGDT